ncbi:MAG: tripartite tricarboxylate transporter substrate binding protein [Alphaproteobacteria bacterium]|nr:tripartite tricarboxylate transporter substrate binding protein [Alphaproteobacteria bacterium]
MRHGTSRHPLWFLMATLALVAGLVGQARAAFPEKPITIIVGLPPGSPNDVLARSVGERLSKRIGKPVVVENRPGAAGMTATEVFVGNAAPDGHTLLVGSVSLGTAFAIRKNRPNFDPEDLTPLMMMVSSPMAVVIPSALPPKTLAEFIAYAKERPGQLNYASVGGIGGAVHLNALLFLKTAGLDMVHVPYPGSPAVVPALISNQVQFYVVDNSGVLAGVQGGNIRALAVAAPQRLAVMPDVPTTQEAGMKFEAAAWYGLFAPKKLPEDIRKILQDHLVAVGQDESFKAELSKRGGVPGTLVGEDFRQFFRDEIVKWQAIVKDANIDQR